MLFEGFSDAMIMQSGLYSAAPVLMVPAGMSRENSTALWLSLPACNLRQVYRSG
jgi:hypothetical protein